MLTFLTAWNDFFWPIIALSSQNPTVQVVLPEPGHRLRPATVDHHGRHPLRHASRCSIVFALLGRQIVGGIMQGAVKG